MARKFNSALGVTVGDMPRVNPHNIHIDENHSRHEVRMSHVDALYEDIKEHGQYNPVIVRVDDDGELRLVSGEHRLRAMRRLWDDDERPEEKRTKIKFTITTEDPLKICALENLMREELTVVDKGKIAFSLKEAGNKTADIAAIMRCSVPQVGNYLKVHELPDEVKKAVTEGQVNTTEAIAMAKSTEPLKLLAKVVDEGKDIAKAVRETGGKSRRTVKDLMVLCEDYKGMPLSKQLVAFFKGEDNTLEEFLEHFPEPADDEDELPVAVEVVEELLSEDEAADLAEAEFNAIYSEETDPAMI